MLSMTRDCNDMNFGTCQFFHTSELKYKTSTGFRFCFSNETRNASRQLKQAPRSRFLEPVQGQGDAHVLEPDQHRSLPSCQDDDFLVFWLADSCLVFVNDQKGRLCQVKWLCVTVLPLVVLQCEFL